MASVWYDEDVKRAWNDEADDDKKGGEVSVDETKDMERVHTLLVVEGRVGEGGDDCEDRGGNIAEDGTPEDGNIPVGALGHDEVHVTAELICLDRSISIW